MGEQLLKDVDHWVYCLAYNQKCDQKRSKDLSTKAYNNYKNQRNTSLGKETRNIGEQPCTKTNHANRENITSFQLEEDNGRCLPGQQIEKNPNQFYEANLQTIKKQRGHHHHQHNMPKEKQMGDRRDWK